MRASAQQSGGLELTWRAPSGCPSREVVRDRVRALVGPSVDNASRLHAEGEITRTNGKYRLSLRVRVREAAADTERVIESDSCADLAGAAAVALGLLMRSEVESQHKATQENTAPDSGQNAANASTQDNATTSKPSAPDNTNPAPAPVPAPVPVPVPDEDKPSDATHVSDGGGARLLLRAPLFGVDVGPLPKPSATLGLAAGVRFDAFALTLGARAAFNQTAWADDTIAYGANIGRATAELRGCYGVRSERFELSPCLLFALDRISARGVGDAVISESQSVAALAAGVGVVGGIRLNPAWALVVLLGGQLELTRARIVADGLSEITQLAPFAFAASTGVEWSP
jgi:hypothetical protein